MEKKPISFLLFSKLPSKRYNSESRGGKRRRRVEKFPKIMADSPN
jgi:hypothetical protein